MIKAVFLDIDDTLLSYMGYVRECMQTGFRKFGIGTYREAMLPVFEQVSGSLWRQLEHGELTFDELCDIRWQLVFDRLGIDFDGPTFEKYFGENLVWSAIPMPGAAELVDYLSGRYVLCAASNGPYEQQVNRLKIAGMYDSFSHTFVSSQVGAQKPDAAFFDRCFEVLRASELPGLRPEETALIGDSMTSDIAGGVGYGMHTYLLQADRREPGQFAGQIAPEHVVTSLAEVMTLL